MGKILLVASDKGGVGKSTYVANTASMLVNKKRSVIILKTDKNQEILSWNKKRNANGLLPIPVHEAYGNLVNEIKRLSKLCEVLIIDCPGHDSQEFRSALTVADILITLVKPSSDFESETLTTVTEKVRTAQQINPKLQPWVLLTRINTSKPRHRTRAIELDKLLREDSVWIQPLKSRIAELDVFENACNEGAGVHDVSRATSLTAAKAQIELVAQEIGIL
ncbi:TPA: peptidyl-arginine deiminase [Klebsiella pneumoniae]|uniref:division plane positioning ATPase MipZ n=1 Tax=Enterobacteriaceae TaxID=543 RepID=UPI00049EA8EE|nr:MULTISPECIES: division plane positioning ATPase MipZ [Enterobacteriaceae]EBZ0633540.1 peptidyl-arginine deiminase [Salmonella enterica subsp. enterica serovar Hvittingfoss]ECD1430994.1 peptidyl-arginine deiminase [Salmonella enterica subsp. enterica serovar Bareilly]ECH8535544.1 peptidyl-arginine deiminase [Salmonella enterica subsp. enterica serovar Lexington]EEJ0020635.1 peptidyl-arginine deiminase [Salmonella enterica subsp. enterica]EIK6273452.1 peptidyl-arginine deiminase [Salmonella e